MKHRFGSMFTAVFIALLVSGQTRYLESTDEVWLNLPKELCTEETSMAEAVQSTYATSLLTNNVFRDRKTEVRNAFTSQFSNKDS